MISQNTIQRIFDTARIEEVIGDFVTLKKSGSSLKGLSPFNNEKTPSFMVSPAKQIFKDFSSNKGGNVVTFLMEHEHFTYPEALRYLAKRYNIEIEETGQSDEQKQERDIRESLFLVNEFALKYYADNLWTSDEGKQIGLTYFKERGFTEETIKEFKLGYSSEDYEGLTKAALAEGYQLQFLEKSGLTKVDSRGNRDRFRGRVLFPILSHTGRTLGFGGRILKSNVKAPKYLNSPESEIYHKSKTLYGIFQAKQSLSKEDQALLVEGYTDVISLHQAGIKNVVASSGTSLTEAQISLLKRYTNNITVLFDGDAAGVRASLRGIDLILKQGVQVHVVLFPDGQDPDSFAKANSKEAIADFLQKEKTDFLQFKASLLMQDVFGNPLQKAQASREMLQSIALIPNELERDAYVKETAVLMEVDEALLFRELAQISVENARLEEREEKRQQEKEAKMEVVEQSKDSFTDPIYFIEKDLCWLLLNYGELTIKTEEEEDESEETTVASFLINDLVNDNLELTHPVYGEVFTLFKTAYLEEDKVISAQELTRSDNLELVNTVTDLITDKYFLHDWRSRKIYLPKEDGFVQDFAKQSLYRFKEKCIRSIITQKEKELKDGSANREEALEAIYRLTILKNQINKELNRVV